MPITPGMWRADDAKWQEILDLWNAEAANRGVANDPFAMVPLLQDIWDLLADDSIRGQQVLHEQIADLQAQISATQDQVTNLQNQLTALGPDPGPATR